MKLLNVCSCRVSTKHFLAYHTILGYIIEFIDYYLNSHELILELRILESSIFEFSGKIYSHQGVELSDSHHLSGGMRRVGFKKTKN